MPRLESARRLPCVWLVVVLTAAVGSEALAAQDGSEAVFNENVVATYRLTISAAGWNAICNDGNGAGDQWQRADLTWESGATREIVVGVGVKRAGKGTAVSDYPKPPINIGFNEFEFANPAGPGTPGRKWRGVNRVKLDSMHPRDYSMMRERISYWTYSQMGAVAPRVCHARLYVNGDYKGLYQVQERVRKDFARFRWGEDDGNLYDVSGWGSPIPYGYRGADPMSYMPSPFAPEENFPGGNHADIVNLCSALNAAADQVRTRLDAVIALDRYLAHIAANTAVSETDGIVRFNDNSGNTNNHWWYHRAGTNRMEIIKWDSDESLGNGESDLAAPGPLTQVGIWSNFAPRPTVRWIQGDATASAAYRTKLRQLIDGPWSSAVYGKIDAIYAQIRTAAYEDRYKGIYSAPWGTGSAFSNAKFDSHVVWLKDWIRKRSDSLRSQLGGTTLPTVTIAATDNAASEPSSVGVFTVSRTGPTTAALNVTLSRSGTAGSGDCNAMPTSFTIPAGSGSATITVTPVDDSAVESSETVILTIASSGSYVVGTPSSATVTIADNDVALPTVTIAATDNAAAEPSSVGVFTVTRTGSTSAALNVGLTRSGTAGSGDCNAMPTTLTIPAGSASATITVTPVDDSLVEGSEMVILTIAPSGSYTIGTSSNATVTISDNDVALPTVTIAATDNAAAEPSSVGVFSVTRTGSTSAALNVSLTRSGTAGSGDCNAMPTTLTIPAGSTSGTITVTPVDDTLVEGSETVILTIGSSGSYTIGSPSTATVTITDNDVALPSVTIAATDNAAAEPSSVGVFTVSRTGSTSAALSVALTRSGSAGSGDCNAMPTTFTIPAGSASATITVTPVDDTAVEGPETVILTLAAGTAYTVGTPSSATVTIADNDTAAVPTVTIAATDNAAAEPSSIGVFTVSRTGSTSAALSVSLTRSGTAGSGDCNAMPTTFTIPAGSASATITVTPVDDTVVEGPETVILTIAAGAAYTVGTAASATVTIADNDTAALPTVTITATAPNAAEPSTAGVFTVTRSGATTAALTVVRVRSGTATSPADYNPLPSPITIPAGQSSVTVTVTPVDDTAVEGSETVILTLSPDAAYTVGTPSSATVTIADNDATALPTVTIVPTDPNAAEPTNTGLFTVTRTGSTAAALTVPRVRTGTATSGTDFQGLPSPIVIPAGQASVTVTVTPIDDTVDEGDETVTLTLSPNAAYTVGAASSATVTIADNETVLPTVTIAATDGSASEAGNTGAFTVTRTGPTTAALSVPRVRTGTATSGTDFQALPSPIIIPAGQASVTVTVAPIDDTAAEGNETVILTLSPDAAYTVGAASSATVTIADNDSASGGLSATYYDNENFTGTSVTRTDATVDFNWADQSPAAGIAPDTFSVRWTGRVKPRYSETYTFTTFTNDGVRLWVEGELLVDKWVQQSGGIEWSAQVALQAGQMVTIQMDHYEGVGNAIAQLSWSSPSVPRQIVPQDALDPALGAPDSRDNDGDGIPNDTDPDDDNDGIPDLQDPDRDGDAVTNLAERASGSDPDDRLSPAGIGGGGVALSDGDNANGDGTMWPNDKCASGSIGTPVAPVWVLLVLALAFFACLKGDRR